MTTRLNRRQALVLGAAAGLAVPPMAAQAQAYPSRAVQIIVGGGPGSVPDVLARLVASEMSSRLGQPFVVENRAGAGGITAMQAMIKSRPDGHTLALATISQAVFNSYLFKQLPYDPMRDIAPISKLVAGALVLTAHPSVSATSLAKLVASTKSATPKLFIGTPPLGSPPHLIAMLITRVTGLDWTVVPYKTGTEGLQDVLGGQIQLFLDGPALVAPHVRAGKLKALTVTGPTRMLGLPDVPTVIEEGFANAQAETWFGLVAPASTSKATIEILNGEVRKSLASAEFRGKLENLGFTPTATSPDEFSAAIRADHSQWGSVIREAGLRLN